MRRIPVAELAGADPRRGAVGDSGAGKRHALGHAGQWRTPAGALRGAAPAAGGSWCGSRPERIGRSRSTTPVSSRIAQEAKSIASCLKVCRDPARISAIPMRRIPLRHLRSSSSSATGRPFGCVSSVCQSRPRTRIPGIHAEHRRDVAPGIQPGPDTIRFCDHGRSLRLPMGGSFNRHPRFGQVGRSPAPAPRQRLPILRPGGIGASASSRALRRTSQHRRSTQSERDPAGWRPFGEAGRRRQGHGAPGSERNGGSAEVEAASGNRRASTGCSCLPAAIGGSFFPGSSASAGPWRSRLSWPHDPAAQPVQAWRRKPSSPLGGPGRGDSGHGPHGGGNRGEGRPRCGRHPSWPSGQRQDRAPRRDRGPPGAGRRSGRAGDGPRGSWRRGGRWRTPWSRTMAGVERCATCRSGSAGPRPAA